MPISEETRLAFDTALEALPETMTVGEMIMFIVGVCKVYDLCDNDDGAKLALELLHQLAPQGSITEHSIQ